MSLKTIYPSFPPIARGNPSVIKTDAKRERIIYANSRTVIIKNVADPTKVQLFTGHQYPVTAVAMSPSSVISPASATRTTGRASPCAITNMP